MGEAFDFMLREDMSDEICYSILVEIWKKKFEIWKNKFESCTEKALISYGKKILYF
jgi:hypothetical protein